jgi:hypothetical protein
MIAVLFIASAIPAMAQTNMKPANNDARTPAVNTPNTPPNPTAPVAGANSLKMLTSASSQATPTTGTTQRPRLMIWKAKTIELRERLPAAALAQRPVEQPAFLPA